MKSSSAPFLFDLVVKSHMSCRFLLKDELIVVQTEEDFTKILTDSRGKENIILTNVKEIGMKGAKKFLMKMFCYSGVGWNRMGKEHENRIGRELG